MKNIKIILSQEAKETYDKLNEPIIVISITRKGQTFVDNLDEVHSEIHKTTSFAIEEGNISGEISTLIDLSRN